MCSLLRDSLNIILYIMYTGIETLYLKLSGLHISFLKLLKFFPYPLSNTYSLCERKIIKYIYNKVFDFVFLTYYKFKF